MVASKRVMHKPKKAKNDELERMAKKHTSRTKKVVLNRTAGAGYPLPCLVS